MQGDSEPFSFLFPPKIFFLEAHNKPRHQQATGPPGRELGTAEKFEVKYLTLIQYFELSNVHSLSSSFFFVLCSVFFCLCFPTSTALQISFVAGQYENYRHNRRGAAGQAKDQSYSIPR
jgi:hypothetical protein